MGGGYNSQINDSFKKWVQFALWEGHYFETFFSFLNRLVKIWSQVDLWNLTDDNFLPLILAPPQHHLGTHKLHAYLLNKQGTILTNERLLNKAFLWPRESRVGGQDGRSSWHGGGGGEGRQSLGIIAFGGHRKKYFDPTQLQKHLNVG